MEETGRIEDEVLSDRDARIVGKLANCFIQTLLDDYNIAPVEVFQILDKVYSKLGKELKKEIDDLQMEKIKIILGVKEDGGTQSQMEIETPEEVEHPESPVL